MEAFKVQIAAIHDVSCMFQLYTEIVMDIQDPGFLNQDGTEIGIDAPISIFIGIGNRTTGDIASDALMV